MGTFREKVAVVTGAGSGIGRALAQALAAEGARLALSDMSEHGLAETLATLPADHAAHGYRLDVSSREQVFAHAEQVERDLGGAQFVFNNAGATLIGTFEHLSIEEIEWQIDVNLWGVVYGCKAFLPQMLARREGCLVNISSVFGLLGFPLQSAYNISKFGVRGLTESLWQELEGTGVRAVCVHPGGIRTSIAKVGRMCAQAGEQESTFKGLGEKMLVTPPETCAADILEGVRRGRRRILTGSGARRMAWLARLLPDHYPAVLRRMF